MLLPSGSSTFDPSTKRTERCDIEALGRFHVARDQVHVVEQPAAMQLLRFHDGYAAEGWLNSASMRRWTSSSERSSMCVDNVH